MIANLHSLPSARFAALCLAICLVTAAGRLHAQSDIVFMTADPGPFQLSNSKLLRFDDGTQTFSVDSGPPTAYVGATVWNGQVLVADLGDGAIQRFSPDGSYLGTFGAPSNPAAFSPTFLESDQNGNVYTTLSPTPPGFAFIAVRFNSLGVETGTFNSELGIDADAAGNVYAIDGSNLIKYAPNGAILNSIPAPPSAWDFSIDEAGSRLYIADSISIKIYDISGAGPVLTGSIAAPPQADFTGVHFAAESGNILVTDLGTFSNNARGLEYSSGGVLLREYFPTSSRYAWDIVTMVPEPSSSALIYVALLTWGVKARGRRRQS